MTTHATRLRVEVEASPAYEFLISLHAFTEGYPRLNPPQSQPRPGPRLASALDRLGMQGSLWNHLVGVAVESRPKSVAALLERLKSMDPFDLILHFLGYYQRFTQPITPEVIAAALNGDQRARERAAARLSLDYEEERATLRRVLSVPAATLAPLILDSLTRWYEEIFRVDEDALGRALAEDAQAKRALANTSPERFVRMVTGVDYSPPRRIRTLVLIPSLVTWPLHMIVDHKATTIFAYAVAPEATDAEAAPRLVKVFGALADGTRLRIIQELSAQTRSVEQLSQILAMPLNTVRYHLALLRSAGLLHVRLGYHLFYSLRPEAVAVLERSLNGLLRPSASAQDLPA
jgi:DNA-binding transcriptional ArsR family regulator